MNRSQVLGHLGVGRPLLVGLLALALSACKCGDSNRPEVSTAQPKPTAETGKPAETAEAKLPPLTWEMLDPVVREVAAAGQLPESINVEFARSVLPSGSSVAAKTILKIEPSIRGRLSAPSTSTLVFKAAEPFAPNTRYTVTLEQVETVTGPVKPPKADTWVREFTTPRFAMLRASLSSINTAARSIAVDLVFSGPVEAARAKELASWTGPSGPIGDVRYQYTQERNVIKVELRNLTLDFKRKNTLKLSLKAGLPMAGRADKAAAAEATIELSGDKPMNIISVERREGPTGHYLEVVCNDDAAGNKRYYWDNSSGRSYGEISRRCQLEDADAQEAIHVEPKVKVSVSPSNAGFRIFGDFRRGTYSLHIDGGARTVDGGMLYSAWDGSFSFPARASKVEFTSDGRYLPKKAFKSLPVKHVNAEQAELIVRQVPVANLVFWMSDDQTEAASERNSIVVAKQTLALKSTPDVQTTTWVDLATIVPKDTRGLLELAISSHGSRATARLMLTDLQLVAKRGGVSKEHPWGEELRVWTMNSETLEPVNAEVKLVRKSGQSLASCTTSADDGCTLKVPDQDLDPAAPFALIATAGDDLTYLKFSELGVDLGEAKVLGEAFRSERAYRASIYADRGVYRPGETAHLSAILRDRADAAPKAGMPVELKVMDPREREYKKVSLPVNEAGLINLDLSFPSFASTGSYKVELAVAGVQAGDYKFNVEEFVPERMKVEAKTGKPGYLLGEPLDVAVNAKYLFGGIPSGSQVELSCELQPFAFKPKENANLSYGIWRPQDKPLKSIGLGTAQGALDDAGTGTFTCAQPEHELNLPGAARLVAKAAVFESGSGRTTQGEATVPVHPERYYLGLSSGAGKVQSGKPFPVSGAVVDWNGKAIKDISEVELELVRLEDEYGWWYEDGEGDGSYQRYQRPVSDGRQKVKVVDGKFSATLTASQDGPMFLVRARAGRAQSDLSIEGSGYHYYWMPNENRSDTTPRPGKPSWLALEIGSPKLKVGEESKVTFRAPYKGKVLLTAETDHVLKSEWIKVEAGQVEWKFKLEKLFPNVYVSAFLVKDPHLDSQESFTPERAFGVKSAPVEPTAYRSEVTLSAPKEVRSNDKLTINLEVPDAEGTTFATVAAVDEGILSLTKFATPDPLSELFTQRALGVETFETVGWTLLLPASGPTKSTGGDGEAAGAPNGRVQPVKPVALWSGLLPVVKGKASVTFQVPTYRGSLRVMAVTVGSKRIGRASTNVVVRDPLTLQTTLPRFLTEGDEIQIPVFLTNLSGAAQKVELTLTAASLPVPGLEAAADEPSPIELIGKTVKELDLKDNEAKVAVFLAKAKKSIGAAKFKVVAKAGNLTSFEENDVPFLPAAPRTREMQRVSLNEGNLDLKALLQGWVPTTEQSTFWVTTNPYGESFQHLTYLLHYPYGCMEQTTSTAWPLIAAQNLIPSIDPAFAASGKIEDMAMAGINRVLAMQTPSGGFGYWPGWTEPLDWATTYGVHFLTDAKKLGFAVPQGRLDDAIRYMEERMRNVYENGGAADQEHYGFNEPYMHYVLALVGKPHKARAEKLLSELSAPGTNADKRRYWWGYGDGEGERLEQVWMLKTALYLAGDRRYEADLKKPDTSKVSDQRSNSWTFYSDRRRRGLMLSTFQDLFGNDASGEPLAQVVADSLKGSFGSYNTQELKWGLTGLAKRVSAAAKEFDGVQLVVNGKKFQQQGSKPGAKTADLTWNLARASEAKSLSLDVSSKGKGELWLFVNSEGVRQKAEWKVGGNGLKLERRYLNTDGNPLDLKSSTHGLGDLVYTEITIKNTSGAKVNNIALVDRFAAGWEIENPRLGRTTVTNWLDPEGLWKPDYMNIRDDRLEVFGSLDAGESRKVIYALRAVTAGSFTAPPVEAEAMYDARIWARQPGDLIKIAGPWTEYLQ